jgi:molecular chaperone DnaK
VLVVDDARVPVAIRITRPYTSADEFLQRELESLTRTTLSLPGAQPRPQGVVLRFEVTLAGGEPLLRGEGRVVAFRPLTPGQDSGLTLRFTRLDARSKALVDRAAAMREARAKPSLRPSRPAPESVRKAPAAPDGTSPASPEHGQDVDGTSAPLPQHGQDAQPVAPPPEVPRPASSPPQALRPASSPPQVPRPASSPPQVPRPASSPPRRSAVPPPLPRRSASPGPLTLPEALAIQEVEPSSPPISAKGAGRAPASSSRVSRPPASASRSLPIQSESRRAELLDRLRQRAKTLTPAAIESLLASRRAQRT